MKKFPALLAMTLPLGGCATAVIEGGNIAKDKVSTIVPMSLAVTSLKGYVTGKPGFVGEASIEVKLTDAQSGELLAAGVDRRSGGKRLGKGFGTWDDVNAIMRFWAKQAAYRLCLLRKDTNCVKPKA